MQLPDDIKPISIIYVYKDGRKFECLDTDNYQKNLSVAGALTWSHGVKMQPVNWEKLAEPLDIPPGVSQWMNQGIKWSYDKYFKIKWPKN